MDKLKGFWSAHPRLASWILLAVGMVAVYFWASKDLSVTLPQRLAMAAATVVLAGLCVWIIYWE